MQPKGWVNLFFWIVFTSSGANLCCIKKVDAARAANTDPLISEDKLVSKIPSLGVTWVSTPLCQRGQNASRQQVQTIISGKGVKGIQPKEVVSYTPRGSISCFTSTYSQTPSLYSQTPPDQTPPIIEQNPVPPTPELNQNPVPPTPELNQTPAPPPQPSIPNNPPQLEGQPGDFPKPPSPPIEERLQVPEIDQAQRLERLLQRLQENKQPPTDAGFGELGTLLVREKPLEQLPPPPQRPVSPPQPLGYLQAHVGYFQTNNIFSSNIDPVEDGLIYSGLTLSSAPLALGRKTYLSGSINGNLIRYLNQSKYNYNQLKFNVGVYQQISRRMYGEIGWTNQQLFYARNNSNFSAGDRFLNENSFRVSVGRRDPLTPKLMLDSFYEFRLSLTDPPSNQDNRDRIINSLWISLNYYLKQSLQVGLDYQFGLSNFTQRQREDQYHRFYGHLTYGVSNYTNLSLQGGVTLGNSTDNNIDFDGWFFSVNYNLELGRF